MIKQQDLNELKQTHNVKIESIDDETIVIIHSKTPTLIERRTVRIPNEVEYEVARNIIEKEIIDCTTPRGLNL